jgi:hypothetical protein
MGIGKPNGEQHTAIAVSTQWCTYCLINQATHGNSFGECGHVARWEITWDEAHGPTRVGTVTSGKRTASITFWGGLAVVAYGFVYAGSGIERVGGGTTLLAASPPPNVSGLKPAAAAQPLPGPAGSGGPGGAIRVHPAGGGGCIIGLNCGCTQRSGKCSQHHARPGSGVNRNVPPPPGGPPDGGPGAPPP